MYLRCLLDIPDASVKVSDKALICRYGIMGILAWGAFGKEESVSMGIDAFCACFGIGDECFQD